MLVHQILKLKANNDVWTVKPGSSVMEAAHLLAEHRIGTVVISADGQKADGILSERDIVRAISQVGTGCVDDTVDAYMTQSVVTCAPSETADAVMSAMTNGRFRHMPVVDGGKMIGLITLGDVVKARLSEISMEKAALEGMIMGH